MLIDVMIIQTAERETGAPLRGKKEGMLGMRGWRKEWRCGFQESRNLGIQKFRNSGIQESGNPGIQASTNLSRLFWFFNSFRQKDTPKLSQHLEKVIQKASKIIQQSVKIDQKSIQNEVWDPSGSVLGPKSIPRRSQRRPNDDFGSILEVKIHQKSMKKAIKFCNQFRKTFLMDFAWILDLFLALFLFKMVIKVEKGDFMKSL